jgi:tape measure domain-containing protein
MPFQAGSAFVAVMPSMRNFQRAVSAGVVPAGKAAGANLSRTVGASAAAAAPAAMVPMQRTMSQRIAGAARTGTAAAAASFRQLGTTATASMAGASGAAAGMSGQLSSMAKMASGLAAAVGLYQLGRAAISSATSVEQSRAALTGLYGDAEQAQRMLARLREVARASPIEFSAFVSGAESLAYMGIQGEQAITVLQRIETAMVASGKGGEAFEQVTEAMLAMVNQGKASAEEINRMSQAGFPAWEMLAQHMNMSIADIRKAVESGEIGIDQMVAAMEAGAGPTFQKMIAAQAEGAQTLSATWARVKDNVVVSLGEMIAPLASRLTPAVNRAGQAITSAFSAAPRVFGQVRDAIVSSGVAAAVGNIYRGLRDIFLGLLPSVKGFGAVLATALAAVIVALNPVADLLSYVGNLMRDNQPVVEALGAAVAGAVLAFAGMKILTSVIVWAKGLRTAMIATSGTTKILAGAQVLLNNAMRANPIGLVVTALGALVAGLIYAYRNSETFRSIVQGAWDGIKAAAMAAWNFLQPMFDALGKAITWIAGHWKWFAGVFLVMLGPIGLVIAAFTFFRDHTMAVLKVVGKAAKILAAVVLTILIAPLILAFKALAAIVTWWWTNVVKPTWNAVAAAARWLWRNALKPVFDAIGAGWQALLAGIRAYWNSVGRPAFNAVAAAGQWLWRNVLRPIFDFIGRAWRALLDGIKRLWETVLRPTWNTLQTAAQWMWRNVLQPIFAAIGRGWNTLGVGIRAVWRNVIKPAWDALVGGLNWVRDRFRDVVNWIGRKWDQLRGLLARPINAVIRTVFNQGIIPAWNFAAGLLPGVEPVEKLNEFRWAQGGPVRGPGTGTSDSIVGRLSAGEHVWTAKEVERAGGHSYVEAMRRAAANGSLRVPGTGAPRDGSTTPAGARSTFEDGSFRFVPGVTNVGIFKQMFDIVRRQFKHARLNSGLRRGTRSGSYHGIGHAVDLGDTRRPGGSGHPYLAAMNRWIHDTFPNSTELIYTGRGDDRPDLKNGRSHRYGSGTVAVHRDHVHWALANAGMLKGAKGSKGGGGGGVFGFIRRQIRRFFEKVTNPLINLLPKAPPAFASIGRGLAIKSRDSLLNFLLGEADKIDAGPGPGSGVQRWRGLVEQMLRLVGQPLVHTNRTLRRMDQESGGDPRAINLWDVNARRGTPSKGLMQVIDPTFRRHRHPNLPNDIWHPAANVAASMRYALSRYGSLPRAYDRPGGYDDGGYLPPGWSTVYNGTRKPEPVLSDAQWQTISRAAQGEGQPLIGTLVVQTPEGASERTVVDEAMFAVRRARHGGATSRG